jgi:hypothetical protein
MMTATIPGSTELFGAIANGMLEEGEETSFAEVMHRREIREGKRRATGTDEYEN